MKHVQINHCAIASVVVSLLFSVITGTGMLLGAGYMYDDAMDKYQQNLHKYLITECVDAGVIYPRCLVLTSVEMDDLAETAGIYVPSYDAKAVISETCNRMDCESYDDDFEAEEADTENWTPMNKSFDEAKFIDQLPYQQE